jgi:hypothetical protein
MGHWADDLVPEVKQRLGITGDEQDAKVLAAARIAESEIELLAGRQFIFHHATLRFDSGELPFVPVPDLQIDSMQATAECWPIPDPVQPQRSSILQVRRALEPPLRAVPKAEALSAAGTALAALHREGWLSLAPRVWFQYQTKAEGEVEFGRRLLDPNRYVVAPVIAGEVEGWVVQVSRRIQLMTQETPGDPGLVEQLAPVQDGMAVVADEPILIVARVTEHPADWAFMARVWVVQFTRHPHTWRHTSSVVHSYGVPILCLDERSTPEEVVAQILLAAFWHGYLDPEDAAIPPALLRAFPRDVERVRRGTDSPDSQAAAGLLFERLLRPGFDPTRGAGSIRHYIARHATTLVRAHRTSEVEFHRWHELGLSERYYYKLLATFALKGPDGRYEVNDEVLAKMRAYLEGRQQRQMAMALLRKRGFKDAAARKWLQRHSIDEIRTARPRSPRRPQ